MGSTTRSRPLLSTIKLTFSRIIFLSGALVSSGWAGCQANSNGIVNPSTPEGGKTGSTTGTAGQSGGGLMTGGLLDADIQGVSDGAAGGSLLPQSSSIPIHDAGSSGLTDAASALGGAPGSGPTGGHGTGAAATGGSSLITDAGAATAHDAPLGGTTNSSSQSESDVTGAGSNTGGKTSTTRGTSDGATGGNPSRPPDAGIDAVINPDVHVPADTAKDASFDASPWHLVWSDEFDDEANTGARAGKWNASTWDPKTVNSEGQKYTARTQNIFHDGAGHLLLRALKDSYKVGPATYPYTSGRIQTDGKFEFKFGRIEIRAKLPAGRGSFPGMVLMGTKGNWPSCGEIGLMEQRGQDKTTLYCSTYSGLQDDISEKVTFPSTTTLSAEFHTYAVEWYADHMVFFVDDKGVARRSFSASSPFATDNNKFYIILDVALGGSLGGIIDDNAFPMDMVLDYVRVYSL